MVVGADDSTCILSVSSVHHYPYHDVSVFFTGHVKANAWRTTDGTKLHVNTMARLLHLEPRWQSNDSSLEFFFFAHSLHSDTSNLRELLLGRVLSPSAHHLSLTRFF